MADKLHSVWQWGPQIISCTVRTFSRISSQNLTIRLLHQVCNNNNNAQKINTYVRWCAGRQTKGCLAWRLSPQRSELPFQRMDPLSKNRWFQSLKLKAKCVAMCRWHRIPLTKIWIKDKLVLPINHVCMQRCHGLVLLVWGGHLELSPWEVWNPLSPLQRWSRKLDIREGWGIVCKTWFWPDHAINVLKVITDSNFIRVGPVPEERRKRKLNSGVQYAGKHVCYAVILGET